MITPKGLHWERLPFRPGRTVAFPDDLRLEPILLRPFGQDVVAAYAVHAAAVAHLGFLPRPEVHRPTPAVGLDRAPDDATGNERHPGQNQTGNERRVKHRNFLIH